MEPKIAYYRVYPGFDPSFINFAVDRGVKAIIIEGYHSGTACIRKGKYNIIPSLKYAKEKNIPVFLIFGHFIGDEDCSVGYEYFEKGRSGAYGSSLEMVKSGITPLRANWAQWLGVVKSLQDILTETEESSEIIKRMKEKYPFG